MNPEERKPKIFVGKVQHCSTQYGDKIKLSLSKDHIKSIVEHYRQGNEWVNITIHQNKKGVWYGEIDTWKPQAQGFPQPQLPEQNQARFEAPPPPPQQGRYTHDDLPPQDPQEDTIPF